VKFPWNRGESAKGDAQAGPATPPDVEQTCPSLAKALEKLSRRERPEVLDLGPFCGVTAMFLADNGARVRVEELLPPPPTPADEDAPPGPALHIDAPDATVDLVLAWEVCDFLDRGRLTELGSELQRVLAPDGWALLFVSGEGARLGATPRTEARRPPRYRVLAADRVLREQVDGRGMPRFSHPNREIERAVAPLTIAGIHLQRSGLREFLIHKRA
jgi:hypothetical protein